MEEFKNNVNALSEKYDENEFANFILYISIFSIISNLISSLTNNELNTEWKELLDELEVGDTDGM